MKPPTTPRNQTPQSESRDIVALRLNAAERETLRRAAERKGLPLSTYIRETAVQSAARDLKKAA